MILKIIIYRESFNIFDKIVNILFKGILNVSLKIKYLFDNIFIRYIFYIIILIFRNVSYIVGEILGNLNI